jgi:hypothetical protein
VLCGVPNRAVRWTVRLGARRRTVARAIDKDKSAQSGDRTLAQATEPTPVTCPDSMSRASLRTTKPLESQSVRALAQIVPFLKCPARKPQPPGHILSHMQSTCSASFRSQWSQHPLAHRTYKLMSRKSRKATVRAAARASDAARTEGRWGNTCLPLTMRLPSASRSARLVAAPVQGELAPASRTPFA